MAKGSLSRAHLMSGFSDKGFPTGRRGMFALQGPRYSGFRFPGKGNHNFTFSRTVLEIGEQGEELSSSLPPVLSSQKKGVVVVVES